MRRAVAKVSSLRMLAALAAAMIGGAVLPTVGGAQEYANQVWGQLNTAHTAASGEGFSLLNYVIGQLGEGGTGSWTIQITPGKSYRIVGFCDNDCSDVDIEVLDGSVTVTKDVLADDYPVVTFSAGKSSAYTVKVIMAACSSEPCYFGIGIFQK